MILARPKEELRRRIRAIRRDFHRRYPNLDVPRQELFDAQSGFCACGCKQPMQSADSIVTEIDHAVSIYLYATWDYPIEEACKLANVRNNLVLLLKDHNTVKAELDLEEFSKQIKRGEINLDTPTQLTSEQIEEMRARLSEGGRKGGRKNVESGHLASIRPLAGRINGRKMAESGQIERVRNLPQSKKAQREAGRKAAESGQIQALGRIYGRINGFQKGVESEHLASIRSLGGRVSGRKAVESGQLASIRSKEASAKGGRKAVESGQLAHARHVRLHVKRNRPNPHCVHCVVKA